MRSGTLACESQTLNQISRPLFQKITPCRKRKGWAWKTKDCLQIHADEAQDRAESNACLGMNCKDSQLARAAIAQLAARRSHNPKVVSSILTRRITDVQGFVLCVYDINTVNIGLGDLWVKSRTSNCVLRPQMACGMRLAGWSHLQFRCDADIVASLFKTLNSGDSAAGSA